MCIRDSPRPVRQSRLEGRVGLRPPHPCSGLPSPRTPRREGGGPRMISLTSALTIPREKLEKFQNAAHIGGVVSAVLGVVSALLPWSYAHEALDDVTYGGAPSPLQYNYIGLAVIAAVLFAAPLVLRKPGKVRDWVAWNTGARYAGYGLLATGFVAVAAIGIESGGLINVDPGGWMALVAGVLGAVSGLVLSPSPEPSMGRIKTHTIVQ